MKCRCVCHRLWNNLNTTVEHNTVLLCYRNIGKHDSQTVSNLIGDSFAIRDKHDRCQCLKLSSNSHPHISMLTLSTLKNIHMIWYTDSLAISSAPWAAWGAPGSYLPFPHTPPIIKCIPTYFITFPKDLCAFLKHNNYNFTFSPLLILAYNRNLIQSVN